MRIPNRFAIPLIVAVAVLAFGASSAFAAPSANWRVSGSALPSNLPPAGNGEFILHVQNIGDAASAGSPLTVVDRLPAGVRATRASSLEGEEIELVPGSWGPAGGECEITEAGRTVTCVYEGG